MTHSISQWKIRLLSLMVATSVFTGGMATLAEPVGAKHKSKKAKKAKARKANHRNDNGNGNGGGAHASTESNKTMTQQATTSNDQQQQSVQVIAPCAINVAVAPVTCTSTPANQQTGPTGGMSSSNTGNQIDSQSNNAGAANQGG
jgi:hypothetical protein